MAELFATSKQLISYYIANTLSDKNLAKYSVIKIFLTTATEGKRQ